MKMKELYCAEFIGDIFIDCFCQLCLSILNKYTIYDTLLLRKYWGLSNKH